MFNSCLWSSATWQTRSPCLRISGSKDLRGLPIPFASHDGVPALREGDAEDPGASLLLSGMGVSCSVSQGSPNWQLLQIRWALAQAARLGGSSHPLSPSYFPAASLT